MYIPKYKHTILLICVAIFVLGLVAVATAAERPKNPTMDYVPQNVGIYDTYYMNFMESDCRVCHGASSAERHHSSARALQGQCCFCHNCPGDPTPPERDCKVCHVDGGPLGDFGLPHHKSDLADSDQCNQCHNPNLLDETNLIDTPNYEPTSITPTPFACENCHWPSGNAPHTPPLLVDWNLWTGYPIPTHFPDGLADPKPIEANGPMFSGTLWGGGNNIQRPTPWAMAAKPFQPMDGTHHEVGGKVYPKCYNCHATAPDAQPSWDPDNPLLIRMCENCHTVRTLHGMAGLSEHVTDGIGGMNKGGYTVDGATNQLMPTENKCVACHGDNMIGLPPQPPDVPTVGYLEPNFGSPGIVVELVPDASLPCTGEPSGCYGQKALGDKVRARQGVGFPWFDIPIYSWSENKIQVKIPAWTFPPGNINIQIVKNGIGNSNTSTFSVRKHPVINSLTPNVGNWLTDVAIGGDGFGVMKQKIYAPNAGGIAYGYSTYVEMHTSNDKYRATMYNTVGGWTPTAISFRVKDLLDINTGNPVPTQELYIGCWNVKVITDYFIDDQVAGTVGDYNLGLAGLDTADTLLYREISDPMCFTVTQNPYINCIRPNPVPAKDVATIYGANFGPTRAAGAKVELCNKLHTTCLVEGKQLFIQSWTATEIKFKTKFGLAAAYPKKKYVDVVVPGKPMSNKYILTITAPRM